MKLAIIGSTSQIATDLILNIDKYTDFDCVLYSRNSDKQAKWVFESLSHNYQTRDVTLFENDINVAYDVIINFVGIGDPAKAKEIGCRIFDITRIYDDQCVRYIEKNSASKYIFLSSGAVYGNSFSRSDDALEEGKFSINNLGAEDWYGLAKLYSEAIHRSLSELKIYDLRVFGYFSRTQDISGRFLLSDIIRTIINDDVLACSSENIIRDYIHPFDFFRLVNLLIVNNISNRAIDCYSLNSIDKFTLLDKINHVYGLKYSLIEQKHNDSNRKGRRYYYPRERMAFDIGYAPTYSSLDAVIDEMGHILKQHGSSYRCG